ncbi:hypothetical protein UVI_02047240 [Ustilaginoidea virens]|uniref:Extracelular serine carboxypeptidase n=1 Tax=Ustilaginoidea virens TaxID=1159556 RepID=A0A1B5L846_USTVR|nr:hypothetical protein UVI_02047240 [Ustilaginoidea virens]
MSVRKLLWQLCVAAALGLLATQATPAAAAAAAAAAALRPGGGSARPRLRRLGRHAAIPGLVDQARPPSVSAAAHPSIKAYNLSVPVDHFHNETKYAPHSDAFFNLRYWVDATHYKDGGPVIILHSGEADGNERMPFLEHGIVPLLARATGGVGVVLEHRYYGTSLPLPLDEAATEGYRFLTTDQAMADTAYFSNNFRIPGLRHPNLTAPATPHILYGGSYAGGLVAMARKLYPDVFWGAISSSGVTEAIDDFWQYFEAMRHFAPGDCSPTMQKLTAVVDKQLLSGSKDKEDEVKSLFRLRGLWNDEFAGVLTDLLPSLQGTNWDPAEDSTDFGTFCAVITSDSVLFPSTRHLAARVRSAVTAAGYGSEPLTSRMLNYIGLVRDAVTRARSSCKANKTTRECFSDRFQEDAHSRRDGRALSWLYQTCTEWGYFFSGESVPEDRLPLVSRALTAEYSSYRCRSMLNITTRPDVGVINKHGGFGLRYPRLAFIDGRQDPWRAAGPHAIGLPGRKSTPSEPFELLDWGVHHWDENGADAGDDAYGEEGLPPKQVVDMQRREVDMVVGWLKEFEKRRGVPEL